MNYLKKKTKKKLGNLISLVLEQQDHADNKPASVRYEV